jgi:hypothetical protein
MLETYFNRVAAWNAARYEQQFDLPLAVRLLKEEYTEWCVAFKESQTTLDREHVVEMLDAIGDVSFVALGVVWKANIDYKTFEEAMLRVQDDISSAACTMPQLHPMFLVASAIDGFTYDNEVGIADSMAMIIHLCALEAKYHFSFGTDKYFEVVKVICDSNDTKVIAKASATEKANDGNKGSGYVSPTSALKDLIGRGFN